MNQIGDTVGVASVGPCGVEKSGIEKQEIARIERNLPGVLAKIGLEFRKPKGEVSLIEGLREGKELSRTGLKGHRAVSDRALERQVL